MTTTWDMVVVGGGHAGVEAAHGGAKLGLRVLLVTMELDGIGRMSCNPAIGGVAKGQLVRDLDALGGLMGRLADRAGIQFRMLNKSKGPAVWGPRAQMDMDLYARLARGSLEPFENLSCKAGEIESFTTDGKGRFDIKLSGGEAIASRTLIITTGTFLGAVMYTGLKATEGGRIGEMPANGLARCIKSLGIKTRRLKTGTPSRLDKDSIDFSKCRVQPGDAEPVPFSFSTDFPLRNDKVCWITHTNATTHEILREGFGESPMFTGKIQGLGPRYCPSVEDKVARFPDREGHQIFLEPEGLSNNRIYVNGFSSSLPAAVQEKALKTIHGLENCKILRYGYAVEYDAIDALQLHPTYESKEIPGLYFAGQVNGTSGYEEAAVQGLMAGINASHRCLERDPFILSRSESYIGVLTDDLVSLEIPEPYRMFTSRAEYRLALRQDNAETRLMEKGHKVGLIDSPTYNKFLSFLDKKSQAIEKIDLTKLEDTEYASNGHWPLSGQPQPPKGERLREILRRPGVRLEWFLPYLASRGLALNARETLEVESDIKYAGFMERQQREIERNQKLSHLHIPPDFNYLEAKALSLEARQKLQERKPLTVGLASRISGVTPADVSGLIYYLNHTSQP